MFAAMMNAIHSVKLIGALNIAAYRYMLIADAFPAENR